MQPPPEKFFAVFGGLPRVNVHAQAQGMDGNSVQGYATPSKKKFPGVFWDFSGGPAPYEITESRNARSSNGPPGPAALPEPRPPGPAPARSSSAARSPAADRPGGAAAGAEPGPPEPCRSRTRSGAAAPPGVYIGNSGRRNATPGPKIFCFPPLTIYG